MAEPDLLAALRTVLLANGAVTALAGTDVYAGELPEQAVERMPINVIVLQSSGGASLTGESDIEADAQRVDLVTYAATPAKADALRAAAARALVGIRRRMVAGVLIHWVNRAAGPTAARASDGHWPQAFQPFQIFHSLKEV